MKIPLMSDATKKIAKEYGCYNEEGGVALRATYIIDDNGVLRHSFINDLPVGRNVAEFHRLVLAFQYTDKYGEVCPAGWKPEQPTLVPDHSSAFTQDYFE